jgi:hypothetical protein
MIPRFLLQGAERLSKNRLLSTIYHEARLRRVNSSDGNPILIYQMGKVGSSSIFDSLKGLKLDRPIFHVHHLNPDSIQRGEMLLREVFGSHYSVNRFCLYEGRFVINHVLQRPGKKLKIISLVRDPVARNLSSFFHNLDIFIPNCIPAYRAGQIGVPEITRHYLQRFHEHTYPLSWFDDEMKYIFGIDVFSAEDLRSRDERVFVYRRDFLELLVLRTEDIDNLAQQALQQFLEVDDFKLKHANVAEDKEYSRVYRDFRDHVKLPEEYLMRMYESKYAKQFYSPQEIQRFYAYWSRP